MLARIPTTERAVLNLLRPLAVLLPLLGMVVAMGRLTLQWPKQALLLDLLALLLILGLGNTSGKSKAGIFLTWLVSTFLVLCTRDIPGAIQTKIVLMFMHQWCPVMFAAFLLSKTPAPHISLRWRWWAAMLGWVATVLVIFAMVNASAMRRSASLLVGGYRHCIQTASVDGYRDAGTRKDLSASIPNGYILGHDNVIWAPRRHAVLFVDKPGHVEQWHWSYWNMAFLHNDDLDMPRDCAPR